MLHKLSLYLSQKLVDLGAEKSKLAVYAYGMECLLSTAIILIIQFVAGALLGHVFEVLLFTVFWLPLRIMTGGFHANTHLWCTVISVGLCIVSVVITDYVSMIPNWVVFAVTPFSYVFIFAVAPIIHKNHPVSNSHRIRMRTAARVMETIEMLLIVLFYIISCKAKAVAFMGFFSTAVLAVIGYFSKNTIKKFD